MERAWHAQSVSSVLEAQKTRREGLTATEAAKRLKKYGPNRFSTHRTDGWFVVLLRQCTGPFVIILLAAAGVSYAIGEPLDALVIGVAILLNTAVGFAQEYKASRTLARLAHLVRPSAMVRRDGRERSIPADEIVPGDILVLRSGDRVAADARAIETVACEANESSLTGESLPVTKGKEAVPEATLLAERTDMFYAGTSVVAGRADTVVVATAKETELGRVAGMVAEIREGDTPLQTELRRLSRWLAWIVVVIVAIVFVTGVVTGRSAGQMLATSVALAVAAVPEGLLVSVTIVLAIGMQRILKRGSLVRRLVAAETLGSVSVICTDKTGTLTEGNMRVTRIVTAAGVAVPIENRPAASSEVVPLFEIAMLCNDAVVDQEKNVSGTPTERALMDAGLKLGIDPIALTAKHPRSAEIPFDSIRKQMATLNRWGDGRAILIKGAPERVLMQCAMSTEKRDAFEKTAKEMAERGLRVLALAIKPVGREVKELDEASLTGATFAGFVALSDPLRAETRAHIKDAADAGIRTVLVTGDHPETALAIAQEAGLIIGKNGLATGAELDAWDDDTFTRRVKEIAVFSRVEPRHKIRIVRAWQASGAVVAMTGDGVNDAPALKAADIGVSLGSGTEVAKESSDVVLLDNNLGTITAAIEQGRVLFDNIRKTAVYLLADSFTSITLIGGAILMNLPLPLSPLHILWVNLVTDSLPAAALTMEPGEPDVMRQKPRPRHEPVLNRDMRFLILAIGLTTDAILFLVYLWLLSQGMDLARIQTIMFAAIGIDTLIYVFAVKSFRRPLFKTAIFDNPWLLGGVAAGVGLMSAALFIPSLQVVFGTVPIGLGGVAILIGLGMLKLVGIEIAKARFMSR